MNKVWTKKWKEVLIWFSGYINFIAFALVGGYTIVKSDDEDLKKTTKTAFIVTLIFTAVSALLLIFHYFGSMFNGYYGSGAYDFYSIASNITAIAKIVVYAVFIIMALVKKDKAQSVITQEESAEEDNQ